jgi:hypothetical protein
VERASNAGTLQRLLGGELLTKCHQTRHLMLSEANLVTTRLSEGEVFNAVL